MLWSLVIGSILLYLYSSTVEETRIIVSIAKLAMIEVILNP